MAELADALDLGSSVSRREGSSPFTRTKKRQDSLSLAVFIFFMILLQNVSAGLHHDHR